MATKPTRSDVDAAIAAAKAANNQAEKNAAKARALALSAQYLADIKDKDDRTAQARLLDGEINSAG